MKRFLFLTLLILFTVSACSSSKKVLKPLKLKKFDAAAKIETLWKKDVGKGQDVRYTQFVPAIAGDKIITSDVRGNVVALDKMSGKKLWEVEVDGRISAGVGVDSSGQRIYLGTYDAEVIALSAEDGTEIWRQTVTSEVLSTPRSNGQVVAVQTLDDRLSVLDYQTGELKWDYEVAIPALTVRGTAAPVVTNQMIYGGFSNGKMYALQEEDGLLEWDQRVSVPQGRGDFQRMVDIDATPILVGEILFSASFQGQIVALSRATGRSLWSKPVSTSHNLASGQGKVYLSDSESSVKAYNVGNGEIVWENNQLLRRKVYAPQTVGSYVAVVDQEGGVLHILSQSDGEFVARKKIDRSGVRSPMVSEGNILYVYSDDGDLVALRVVPIDS